MIDNSSRVPPGRVLLLRLASHPRVRFHLNLGETLET